MEALVAAASPWRRFPVAPCVPFLNRESAATAKSLEIYGTGMPSVPVLRSARKADLLARSIATPLAFKDD